MEKEVKDTNIQNSFTYKVLKKEGEKLTSVMTTWMMMIIIIMILGVEAKRQKGTFPPPVKWSCCVIPVFFLYAKNCMRMVEWCIEISNVDMHTMQ